MDMKQQIEYLDKGVGTTPMVSPTVRHNDNSLDVIMAEKLNGTQEYKLIADEIGGHALTITFKDSILFQYKETYLIAEVNKIFKKTKGIKRYCFINDYSNTGRFHLHGVIKVDDLSWILKLRRKLNKFGITKVKLIDNLPKWNKYCIEQYTPQGKHNVIVSLKKLMIIHN